MKQKRKPLGKLYLDVPRLNNSVRILAENGDYAEWSGLTEYGKKMRVASMRGFLDQRSLEAAFRDAKETGGKLVLKPAPESTYKRYTRLVENARRKRHAERQAGRGSATLP